jgi:putative FmdB family regulatory protein
MPIYEYRCRDCNCGFVSEQLRSYAERQSAIQCQKCGLDADYTGLCASVAIVPPQFGVMMDDGTRVAGNIGKTKRKRRNPRSAST